jgi:hypothetical protein
MIKWLNFWDEFKAYDNRITNIEEDVIREAFNQIVEGNSFFEDLSSPEMRSHYNIFKWGWISACMAQKLKVTDL